MTQVELVDADGTPLGGAEVDEAHRSPGLLHRAFSVFLRDESGRVLLQQRAAAKTRFPLRWGNTCCGHPAPGEPVAVAAARRMTEEIGVTGVTLTEVGVYSYYAEDPATGRVEYEYDHVLVGDVPAELSTLADPEEVADLRWASIDEIRAGLAEDPRSYAPWLVGVTAVLAGDLSPDTARSMSVPSASLVPDGSPAASVGVPSVSSLAPDSSSGAAASSAPGAPEPSGGG